jgi:hypothetical protein
MTAWPPIKSDALPAASPAGYLFTARARGAQVYELGILFYIAGSQAARRRPRAVWSFAAG